MSYAQRHRSRLELQQNVMASVASSTGSTHLTQTPVHATASAVSGHATEPQPPLGHRPPSLVIDGAPQRSNSALLRVNASRLQQSHSAGIDIAAWSEAASSAVAGERQPFQLLQRTPPKNEPPRLRASRKQFASPHVTTTATAAAPAESNPSEPLSLPIVVGHDSPVAADKGAAASLPDGLATDLRTGPPAHATSAPPDEDTGPSQEPTDAPSEARAAGETSPSPIPVSLQPSQPPAPFADSSAPSSARLSTSQWPASETFAARLKNIMETRQQIEALVQRQRADEEEMVHAIAALDEQSALHQSQQQQQSSSPGSASPRSGATTTDAVRRRVYEQVVMERDAAFAALREFKEKGNVIVHHLYDTVKSQQEQTLELVATVEALKKANKRLKDALSSSGGRAGDSRAAVPDTVAELQQKVSTQRRVIEQMDQLMQNADRMLLAMRARVEAAERRAASATAPPLDRRQLPPLPKGNGARPGPGNGEAQPQPPPTAAAAASPDAVGALERLSERYPADHDVATVAVQQQLLLDRIGQLRQALKQEEAQRLHLEEVYGATSEETARNVALLEERLQRAENPRGVPYSTASPATGTATATALREELHTLLEQEGKGRAPTPSNASSPTSSRSSTPTRTLFTAVSVADLGTNRAVDDAAEEEDEGGAAPPAAVDVEVAVPAPAAVEEIDAEVDEEGEGEVRRPAMPPTPAPASPVGNDDDAIKAEKKEEEEPPSPEPKPKDTDDAQQQQQPRAFLGGQRSAGRHKADAAAGPKVPLGIPIPEASSLGNSLRRSFNSRSSSASRRLVDYRSIADATSRGLVSDEDVDVDVDVEAEEVYEDVAAASAAAASAALAAETSRTEEKHNGGGSDRAAGITGVTVTITPTAIHSASSPLPDTSTSAEMSAKRQQRLHQQMEELDRLEADVTNVVRSLDVA